MACLNINSLVSHIDDLRVFMSQFKDIDILAINQTKLDATIKTAKYVYQVTTLYAKIVRAMAGMVVVFVFIFIVISIFSFVLILVRIILNVSLLKSLNPAQSLSSCLPATDHHNHLLTSYY